MAQYEAAMIAVQKPGFFSRAQVREACNYIIANQPPEWISHVDHRANVQHAHTVKWAHIAAMD